MRIRREGPWLLLSGVPREAGLHRVYAATRWLDGAASGLGAWRLPVEEIARILERYPTLSGDGPEAERILQIGKNVLSSRARTRARARERGEGRDVWSPELKPFAHQRATVGFLSDHLATALWHDTGLGKTISGAIWLGRILGDDPLLRKAWVVCPRILIETAWVPDLRRWFPGIPFVNVRALRRKERARVLQDRWRAGPCVAIVNYEALRADEELRALLRGSAVIFDESSKMKNHRSLTFRSILSMSKLLRAVLLLSGTPAPNTPAEYYPYELLKGQITGRFAFPESAGSFERRWFYRFANKLILRPNLKESFYARMSATSQWLRKDECLDLPESITHTVQIPMPAKAWETYRMIEQEILDLREDGEDLQAFARLMRLRQITAGFRPNKVREWIEGQAEVLMLDTDHAKDDWCVEFASDVERCVIWCQFYYEIDRLADRLEREKIPAAVVDGRTKQPEELIERFNRGDLRVLVMHPRKAQFGISLPGCRYSVFHSASYSHEEYVQAQNRIHGIGRGVAGKDSIHYVLQATGPEGEDTIDQKIYDAIQGKKSQMQVLFEMDRRRRETA